MNSVPLPHVCPPHFPSRTSAQAGATPPSMKCDTVSQTKSQEFSHEFSHTLSFFSLSTGLSIEQAKVICMHLGCGSLAALAELEHVALENLLVRRFEG